MHLEVPRLGVNLELQLLVYITTTASPDLSYLHHSSWQRQIIGNWTRPWIEPASSWMLVRFISPDPQQELPPPYFTSYSIIVNLAFLQIAQHSDREA